MMSRNVVLILLFAMGLFSIGAQRAICSDFEASAEFFDHYKGTDIYSLGYDEVSDTYQFLLTKGSRGVLCTVLWPDQIVSGLEAIFEDRFYVMYLVPVNNISIIQDPLVRTGRVRLTMDYERFLQPVSVIAIGPAVTAALMFNASHNPLSRP